MSSQNLRGFGALWDFANPGQTETKFRGILPQIPEIETRIAAWCVARTQRSPNRIEEALTRQMALKDEFESEAGSDGYVFEEIGECLLAFNRPEEARPYFLQAYEILTQDAWLVKQEPERLARSKELGEG